VISSFEKSVPEYAMAVATVADPGAGVGTGRATGSADIGTKTAFCETAATSTAEQAGVMKQQDNRTAIRNGVVYVLILSLFMNIYCMISSYIRFAESIRRTKNR
jgi:hypothetical protein